MTLRRALLGAALALPALRRAGAQSPGDPIRINHGGPGSAGSVWRPLVEARLPPELDLRWIGANPGQVQVQLLAGTLDVGVFGALGAADAVARGADLVIFGPGLLNHGRWIVREDSPYRTPADLVGKRIATQPETTETYRQARMAAQLSGLDLRRDFRVVFGPPTANLALFARGDVDGVIVLEPIATRLVASGAREIARVGDMWRAATGEADAPFLVGLAARRAWVEANRPAAAELARTFAAANGEIRARPARLSELHRAMGIPDAERAAIGLLPERLPAIYQTEWGPPVFAGIERQLEVALANGLIERRPAVQPYLDLEG